MQRRQLLLSAPALMLASAVPAFAQAGPRAIVSTSSGNSASAYREGEGFLLEVSGLRFNLGMPPTNRLGNFEIQDLMSHPATAEINGQAVEMTLQSSASATYSLRGHGTGTMRINASRRGGAAGFLVIVTGMAAVLGPDGLREGGRGMISLGETSQGFLLEVSG